MKVKLFTAILVIVLAFGNSFALMATQTDDFGYECHVTLSSSHDCQEIYLLQDGSHQGGPNPGTCSGCCWGGGYTCPGCGLAVVTCYKTGAILGSFRICVGIC